MNRKNIIILISLILLVLVVAPVGAEDTTPVTPDSTLAVWLPSIALGVLTIALLGVIWLAREAFQQAGVNISPDSIAALVTPIADNLRQQLANDREQAAATVTPIDDSLVSLKAIPIEWLLQELAQRGYIAKQGDNEEQPDPLS